MVDVVGLAYDVLAQEQPPLEKDTEAPARRAADASPSLPAAQLPCDRPAAEHAAAEPHVPVGLFGAAPDTANMGVSALCYSFLDAMRKRIERFAPLVFDNGLGFRETCFELGDGTMRVRRFGARSGRRYYRAENLTTMAMLAPLRVTRLLHRGISAIDSCSVILDASAGDSFSDLYGARRFNTILLPKVIARRRSKPLVLLPQTYGPFRSPRYAGQARAAILSARLAWARDAGSYEVLRELLGADFDPAVHRLGVDMAFGLHPRRPADALLLPIRDWLEERSLLVGVNVSGLVWNMGREAARRFAFKADYRALASGFIEWLIRETDANVLLVPHVLAPGGAPESDHDAAVHLIERARRARVDVRRLRIAPGGLDAQELKWLIGRCAWFCGTRMHSTIAALSSGVPASTIVYSDKAEGIFASCGLRSQVIDPRKHTRTRAFSRVQEAFAARGETRATLQHALPGVLQTLERQMDEIAAFVRMQG